MRWNLVPLTVGAVLAGGCAAGHALPGAGAAGATPPTLPAGAIAFPTSEPATPDSLDFSVGSTTMLLPGNGSQPAKSFGFTLRGNTFVGKGKTVHTLPLAQGSYRAEFSVRPTMNLQLHQPYACFATLIIAMNGEGTVLQTPPQRSGVTKQTFGVSQPTGGQVQVIGPVGCDWQIVISRA